MAIEEIEFWYSYSHGCLCLQRIPDFGIPYSHGGFDNKEAALKKKLTLKETCLLKSTLTFINNGRRWVRKRGAASTIFAWGRNWTEQYVTRGNLNFLILPYSFFLFPTHNTRLYRIPQNISPFLIPIIVVSIVYYVYAVHHRSRSK